jgi:hypothetical protein
MPMICKPRTGSDWSNDILELFNDLSGWVEAFKSMGSNDDDEIKPRSVYVMAIAMDYLIDEIRRNVEQSLINSGAADPE